MNDPATDAFYEREAARYAHALDQRPSRFLDAFLDRLPPRSAVLELGCGAGRDAAHMATRGFVVDPTDGSHAMVRLARERTGLPVRRLRFAELDGHDRYDAVWANACLIHVARADFPAVLAVIRAALRPGGWHFASFKLGDGERRDPLGRLTNFPDEAWLEDAYRAGGFTIAETERYRGEGADGVVRDWCALTLRRD